MGLDFVSARHQLRKFNRDATPERVRKALYEFFEPPPNHETLYHYTRQSAFQGIVENKELWLTDLCFFNDRTESDHASSVLRTRIKARVGTTASPLENRFLRLLLVHLRKNEQPTRYVTCFSLKGDDLNQWRSYASPGAGYCLGFSRRDLRLLALQNGGLLSRCIYSAADKDLAVNLLIDTHVAFLDGCFPFFGRNEINEGLLAATVEKFFREFTKIAPLFKHEAFAEEAEIRLVLGEPANQADVRFRSGSNALIPYLRLSLVRSNGGGAFPGEIIAKTSPEPELMLLGLRKFLKNKGYHPLIARASSIPYRESI